VDVEQSKEPKDTPPEYHSYRAPKDNIIMAMMFNELRKADQKYHDDKMSKKEIKASFQSIKCEMQELKREISRKTNRPDLMKKEAVQVLAMAFKFMRDVCMEEK
jgi:hypothetical protein